MLHWIVRHRVLVLVISSLMAIASGAYWQRHLEQTVPRPICHSAFRCWHVSPTGSPNWRPGEVRIHNFWVPIAALSAVSNGLMLAGSVGLALPITVWSIVVVRRKSWLARSRTNEAPGQRPVVIVLGPTPAPGTYRFRFEVR